jgi:hypothetical protein
VTSSSVIGSVAFRSLRTQCALACAGASDQPSAAVTVPISEKVDLEVVDIERVHLVQAVADLGLLLSGAYERRRQGRSARL